VLAALRTTGAPAIDLFFAGPAALAIALGHRWNALPPTQLYEFLPSERRYVKTALLLDRVVA
jgi:CBASS immunity sensor of nucleotide second messenger signals